MHAADDLLSFIQASPTPWHAVAEATRRLQAAGYRELREADAWDVKPGDKIFVVRAGSTLAALEIGDASPESGGFRLIGAHTDSPNLRVKPNATVKKHGQVQLAVEIYGGVLLYTWVDRDLGLAGRLHTRGAKGLDTHLVRIDAPLMRTPSLAIHLDRQVNEALTLNPQNHLPPLIALEGAGGLDLDAFLCEALAASGGAKLLPKDLVSSELCAFDVVPPTRSGAHGEFVHAPRLDDLGMCHAAICALIEAPAEPRLSRGIFLFDHEECGSLSAQGAQSPFLRQVLERVVAAHPKSGRDAMHRAVARSFFVSADMAHAIHPSYPDKHEPGHQPALGAGPVIKTNANQRYATDADSSARFTLFCEAADVTPQHFVTRTDMPCGSTIGPITAGNLGMRVVDVGNPMLSMHSCREMCGSGDVAQMIGAMRAALSVY